MTRAVRGLSSEAMNSASARRRPLVGQPLPAGRENCGFAAFKTVRNPGSTTGAVISSANEPSPVLAKYIGGGSYGSPALGRNLPLNPKSSYVMQIGRAS